MSIVQTRRSISINGKVHTKIREWAQANDQSVSGITQQLIEHFLEAQEQRKKVN